MQAAISQEFRLLGIETEPLNAYMERAKRIGCSYPVGETRSAAPKFVKSILADKKPDATIRRVSFYVADLPVDHEFMSSAVSYRIDYQDHNEEPAKL